MFLAPKGHYNSFYFRPDRANMDTFAFTGSISAVNQIFRRNHTIQANQINAMFFCDSYFVLLQFHMKYTNY